MDGERPSSKIVFLQKIWVLSEGVVLISTCQVGGKIKAQCLPFSIPRCVTLSILLSVSDLLILSQTSVIFILRWQVLLPSHYSPSQTRSCVSVWSRRWLTGRQLEIPLTFFLSLCLKPFKSLKKKKKNGGVLVGRRLVLSHSNTCTWSIVPFKASSLHK